MEKTRERTRALDKCNEMNRGVGGDDGELLALQEDFFQERRDGGQARGERFRVDLENAAPAGNVESPGGMIKDIVEHDITAPALVPSGKAQTPLGFPLARKKKSVWAQTRARPSQTSIAPAAPFGEKAEIDAENQKVLATMGPEEAAKEKEELMANLDPCVLQKLLQRSNMEDRTAEVPVWREEGPSDHASHVAPGVSVHFPRPNKPAPALDPSDPDFLANLHSNYFAELPSDSSKLSWMQPVSKEEDESEYHPSQQSLSISSLRFDFKGNLVPPSTSRQLSAQLGLHHHADAPAAAGYSIPELAHLARSSFASQKCMALQTLGRILYKLGKRAFGEELSDDLWTLVEAGRVTDTITEAANQEAGNISVRNYATEAAWLWQQGGGRGPRRAK